MVLVDNSRQVVIAAVGYLVSLAFMYGLGERQSAGQRPTAVKLLLSAAFPILIVVIIPMSIDRRWILVAGVLVNFAIVVGTGLKPLNIFPSEADIESSRSRVAPLRQRVAPLALGLLLLGLWLLFAPTAWGGVIGGI